MFQLFLLVTLFIFSCQATSSYFINENYPSSSPDGSSSNPFTSLSEAISALGATSCSLYLRGDNISISTTLTFPIGADYVILPDPSYTGSHFPFILKEDGSLKLNASNLTLQSLEILDLNTTRPATAIAITMASSNLYMHNVLMRNIIYSSSSYLFLQGRGSGGVNEVVITDSTFRGLYNVELLALIGTKLTMRNNTFKFLVNDIVPFIIVSSYNTEGATCSISNFTIENVVMGSMGSIGFFTIYLSRLNLSITDFTIKNVNITNQFPLIMINLSKNDSLGATTSVAIKNGYIEGLLETNNFTTLQTDKSSLGLFLRSQGPSNLIVDNLTLNYTRFKNYNFISFIPAVFLYSDFTILPYAQITNVAILNSTNTNFWLWKMDTVNFTDIRIQNNMFSDLNVSYYLFDVQAAHQMTFQNIYVENNAGPIVSTEEVLLLNISNMTINDATMSQDLIRSQLQNLIYIITEEDPGTDGLDPTRPVGVTMSEINVNGFADINGGNSTEESKYPYIILIYTIIGDNYLTNCHWKNVVAGGISSQTLKYIKIENVTVEQDIGVPFSSVMKHEFFAFIGIETLEMFNCQFLNNQNAVLFSLYNIERTSFFQKIKSTTIKFNNITAINNTANYVEDDTGFPSPFMFYSPQKPVSLSITNSSFYNNTALTGLISITEINQLTSVIQNNTFDLNVAVQSGGVIWAMYLRQNANTLNVINNTFTNNFCQGVGGVYYIVLTNLIINLSENNYISNSATTSGGVGYISRSDVSVTETNSNYTGNSAGSYGGAWYLNLKLASNTSPRYTISNVQYIQSTANQKGGAFFIEAGNLAINNCSFQKSKALTSGSEFYISATSLFQIINSNFTESYGSQATFIYGDNVSSGSIVLSNISISNIQYTSKATLIQLNQGLLKITNSVFSSINCPLFDAEGTTVIFKNLSISDITCKSNLGYCIMTGTPTTLTFNDSKISNVVSNSNLFYLSQSTKTAFNNLQISNIQSSISSYLSSQTYIIKANFIKTVSLYNSSFASIQFSGIKTVKSTLNILDTNFTNQASTSGSRLLQSTTSNIQFLNVDSSNTSITHSLFIQNSPKSTLNGGAMRIIGTGGSHQIDGSTFQGNSALSGGAISVEGIADSLTITNSDFLNNIATQNGGAIVFAPSSVTSQPMISQVSFIGNQAKVGGALFILEQVLTVQNSLFSKNKATSVGGAIASFAATSNVYIQDNVFSKNSALQGAALMSLWTMVFMDSSTNIFEANLATYGTDVATNPVSLRLQVYQVSSYYVFLDTASPSKMLANDETVLIYDSTNSSLQDPLLQNSGVNPNFLYKFSLYDAYGNVYPIISDVTISLSILSYETTGKTNQIGILGTPIFTTQDNSMFLFNSISLRGANDTRFVLAAQASYYDNFTALTRTLPALEFSAELTPCDRGQIYNNETSICTPCGSGTYSLGDPTNTSSCEQCLDHAICLGGDMFYPEPGYWRIDSASTNFIPCIQTDSCLGGILAQEAEVSQIGFCAEGYEGVACSVCSSGYAKFGEGHKCENCADDEWYYVRFALILCVQMAVTAIAVWTMITKIYSEEKRPMNLLKSSILLITIDFIQVLNLISEFNFKWPSSIQSFWSVTTKIVPSNADALSIDCFLTLIKGNSDNLFFTKVIILVVQPFFYIGVGCLFWTIRYKMTPTANRSHIVLRGKIAVTIITIVYILMPGIIKSVLDLFKCRNYGSLENPQNFLADDTNVECWTPYHWAWSLSIAFPALFIWLVIPLTIMFAALYKKPYSFLRTWTFAYRNVFDRYKEKLIFWELLVLARKLIIIAIALIISSTYIQSYVAFIFIFILLQLHDRFVPAQDPDINTLEVLNLYTIVLIIYSGLYFIQSVNNTVASNIILCLDFLCGGLFLFYTLRFLYRIFWKKINPVKPQVSTSPIRVLQVPKPLFRKQNHGGLPFTLDHTVTTNPISSTTNTEAPLAPTTIREKDVLTAWSMRTPRAYGRSFVNWKRLNPRPISQLEALNLEAHLSPRSPKSITSLFQRRLSFQEGSLRDLDHPDFKRRSVDNDNDNDNNDNENNENYQENNENYNENYNENNELETEGQSERLTTTGPLVTSPANDEIAEEAILISLVNPRAQRTVFFEQNRKWQ